MGLMSASWSEMSSEYISQSCEALILIFSKEKMLTSPNSILPQAIANIIYSLGIFYYIILYLSFLIIIIKYI